MITKTRDEVVVSDEFDRDDMERMLNVSHQLREAFDQVADATPTGEALGPDLWSSLLRIAPRKVDTVPPRLRVNETVIDRIWEADAYRDLHDLTMGDPVNASMGVVALARKVTGMLAELDDVAEQAEKAQAAQDALDEAMGDGDGDEAGSPGEGDGEGDGLDELRASADAESEILDAMLDDQAPKIDRAVRAGLEEAAAEAAGQAAAATAWGLEPGDAQQMDPQDRIRLMRTFSQERIREIADLLGVMDAMNLGNRDRKFEMRPGEIHSVTLGGNLARLVPGELVALAIPEMEDLLLDRLAKRRARVYLTRAVERAGRGAIIYLEDGSSSMKGAKTRWSKAFGLALRREARRQDRAFHAIVFHGAGTWRQFDFPDPHEADTARLLEYASVAPSGGTELTGPLDAAVALLKAEYDKGGNVEGDIILGTDGEVKVPDAWLAEHLATRDALQFNTYGLAIQARLSTLRQVCTHLADVLDLTSGRDVANIFETIHDH